VSHVPGDDRVRAKWQEFARTRDARLRVELTEEYLPLAAALAARLAGRFELDDLEQAANLALLKAIDRFDPDRGFEFTTFAWTTISGELKRHLRDRSWGVRVPRRVQEHFLTTARAVDELQQVLGRPPTVRELGGVTGLSDEETIEALEARDLHRLPSIDAPPPSSVRHEGAWEPSVVDDRFDRLDDQDLLARLLERLAEPERELLRLRFAEELTQSDIAARIGVSQMHVSRRLSATLDRLRVLLDQSARV